MALNGSVETNKYAERYYKLNWTATQDIGKNQSTISWTLSAEGAGWWAERTLKVVIAGQTVLSKTDRVERWDGVIKSGSLVVDHDTVGYKEFEVKIEAAVYTSAVNLTGSGKFVLDTIPRKATIITAPNFSDGDNPTITYSNPAGNNVDVLAVAIYNADASYSYIPYKFDIDKTGTSYTFNLTEEEREILRNAAKDSNSIDVRFYLHTQIGEQTFLSYLQRTFSVNDANPKISAIVEDVNEKTIALTGDKDILVKYYSSAKATMLADAQKGATLKDDTFTIANGVDIVNGAIHTFENVESDEFVFSVEDSRGNVGMATITPQMVEYTKLTCNLANNRPDALGNMTVVCNGDYFNGNFGAVENTLTVQYRYAVTGVAFSDDDWQDMSVIITGNSYIATADFEIPDFNQQTFYSFETRAIDKLDTVSSNESKVKSIPIFHWGENDFVFEVPVTFNAGTNGGGNSSTGNEVVGDLNVTGNLRLKGSGNYGNTLLFGDGTYCYISEPEDDVMHIKASRVDFNANGVYVYGKPIPEMEKGVWTPALNSSVVSSYTTQYGWYSKMGQTVCVGFYVKATCKSGYTSTLVTISGLPFTPMFTSAGGGMCSGAYISGGYNFQCFVAETSKSITTRVQSCNHTSQTNLSTSASGCWYPSGGGEITLSGTITFIANS